MNNNWTQLCVNRETFISSGLGTAMKAGHFKMVADVVDRNVNVSICVKSKAEPESQCFIGWASCQKHNRTILQFMLSALLTCSDFIFEFIHGRNASHNEERSWPIWVKVNLSKQDRNPRALVLKTCRSSHRISSSMENEELHIWRIFASWTQW